MKAADKKKAGTGVSRGEAVHRLWVLSVELHEVFAKVVDGICASVGLGRPQFEILFVLKYSVKPVRIADLASYTHQNPNSVSMLVDRMAKQGLVKRVRSTRDRRVVTVKLTDHGNHVVTQAMPTAWQMIKAQLSVFSDSEISLFSVVLEELRQHLSDELIRLGKEMQAEGFFKELGAFRIQNVADTKAPI